MDGGRDFEGDAARLGPQGGALLRHAATRMKPAPASAGQPAAFKDRGQVERARDILAPLADANSDLLPIVAILDALLGPGKGAASDLLPGLGRSKPGKIGKPRAIRRALWLDFATRLDPDATMSAHAIYQAFFGFQGRFEDSGGDIQPASGDFGYQDIFWQLQRLPKTVSPVVRYPTFLGWLKTRRKIKTKTRHVMKPASKSRNQLS